MQFNIFSISLLFNHQRHMKSLYDFGDKTVEVGLAGGYHLLLVTLVISNW